MQAPVRRSFDVLLYGATGFVGAQTVAYFARHAGGLRWALGGRDAARLEAVRDAAGPGAAQAGIVVADAQDAAALRRLARKTRVVLSTAGLFALYGSALVAATGLGEVLAQRLHAVGMKLEPLPQS